MELLALVFILALIAALILSWVNIVRAHGHSNRLELLESEVKRLARKLSEVDPKTEHVKSSVQSKAVPKASAMSALLPESERVEPVSSKLREKAIAPPSPVQSPVVVEPVVGEVREDPISSDAGTDWFGKLSVWVGGIALIMAGFYMVKYSIDSGWLTPVVRIWLTAIFGALLCASGFFISMKSKLSANERIGQVLTGAGVACFYFVAYASVHLYSLMGPGTGFGAMVTVTILAVALSLKHGAPIAMMGLVGGFLTPWLMSTGSSDTVMLFAYLFLLFCGAQYLCMRLKWWSLLLGSLLAAYLWSGVVIVSYLRGFTPGADGVLFFILGICAVNAAWVCFVKADGDVPQVQALLKSIRVIAWGGGLFQSCLMVLFNGFLVVDMSLFAILSVAALVLAVIREEEFLWASCIAFLAVSAGVLCNPSEVFSSWFLWPAGLFALFFLVGHWCSLTSERAMVWRVIACSACIGLTPLLYLNRELLTEVGLGFEAFYLVLATLCSGALMLAGEHLLRRKKSANLVGQYHALGVFLVGFGLWTYVPSEYLVHSVAGLGAFSMVYWKLRKLELSDCVLSVLGLAWGLLMLESVVEAIKYFFEGSQGRSVGQDGFSILAWALGVITGVFALNLFKAVWSPQTRRVWTWILGVLGLLSSIAIYQYLDHRFLDGLWGGETVVGALTALLASLAGAFVCLRKEADWANVSSRILAVLVGVRIVIIHLAGDGAAGTSFFFNALFLQFGIPFLASFALAWMCGQQAEETWRKVYQISAMFLGFIWSTFLVEDYFGGSDLLPDSMGNTQLYAYSVIWLVFAVFYQAIGLWRNQKAIHVGSLLLLLLAVGKAFLVDASELEGLFRVLSFLGLGIALIGIGFFYNKVVFGRRTADKKIHVTDTDMD